jgi:hypothetical protein
VTLPTEILQNPNWWVTHLHESAAAGSDGCFPEKFLTELFETNQHSLNEFWKTINMDNEFGYFPQVHIGLPKGHVISIVYFGSPRYDVEFRYGTPTGLSVLLAVAGPNAMLSGLRWDEVRAISSLVPYFSAETILLLIPIADIMEQEKEEATSEISKALLKLGIKGNFKREFISALYNGQRSENKWYYHNIYGWIKDDLHCWRCPKRQQHNLAGLSESQFQAIKDFTEYLELNPKS